MEELVGSVIKLTIHAHTNNRSWGEIKPSAQQLIDRDSGEDPLTAGKAAFVVDRGYIDQCAEVLDIWYMIEGASLQLWMWCRSAMSVDSCFRRRKRKGD